MKGSRKLGELLATRIAHDIAEAELAEGDLVGQEPELIERYGVGRGVLREAIRLLEHQSIVTMRKGQGGGLVVSRPAPDATIYAAALYLRHVGVEDSRLLSTRQVLEHAVIDRLLDGMTKAAERDLRDQLDRERAATVDELLRDGRLHEFHTVLARLTGDPALAFFIDVVCQVTFDLADVAVPVRIPAADLPRRRRSAAALRNEHVALGDAILDGDAALAHKLLDEHVDQVGKAVVRTRAAGS